MIAVILLYLTGFFIISVTIGFASYCENNFRDAVLFNLLYPLWLPILTINVMYGVIIAFVKNRKLDDCPDEWFIGLYEKLFENAGIKKCNRMLPCPFENQCEDCEFNWFPDFTAEKQLDLIKWLSTKELKIRTNKQPYAVYIGVLGDDNTCFFGCEGLYFEQTLAEVINNLWQSLTNKEKEEIRGILNE